MTQRTLFLLDGMALAYRAYFAFIRRPRINPRGENVSAVYGFTTTLLKLIWDHELRYCAVAMDAGEQTFRNELYQEYKQTRDPPPDDLIANLPLIGQVVQALGLPILQVPGVEADDVIGSLALQAAADGHQAIIVSPDKDFQQLLTPSVSILKPRRGDQGFDPITHTGFEKTNSLKPRQFIDMLALMGDKSDNVPGVRGIGLVTARKLLQAYGSLENLLLRAGEIKGKRAREGLLANADIARLSKELVTIKLDVPVSLDWDAMRRGEVTDPVLRALFARLGFQTQLRRIEGEMPDSGVTTHRVPGTTAYVASDVEYGTVATRQELVELEGLIAREQEVGLGAVHDGGPPIWTGWAGLSVAWSGGQARYIPLPLPDGTSANDVLTILAPVLTNRNVSKVGHGLKPLIVLLGLRHVHMEGTLFDTQVAHYLLAPETSHDLRFVAKERLRYEAKDWIRITGSGKKKRSVKDLATKEVLVAACESAALPLMLKGLLENDLKQKNLGRVALEMEFPLIYVLARMEIAGVPVSSALLQETGTLLKKEMHELEQSIYESAGKPFNVASPQQVGTILFEEMGLPVRRKTSKGKPSTAEAVLVELAIEHDICGMILDWRKASRLVGTYVAGLDQWIRKDTGRIHTVFNQTTAATGRLSSSDPGLQNIPVRSASGRELRRAFGADGAWQMISADYSQIELRILAHMSQDENLARFFIEGRDPHAATAARIHGIPAEEVTRAQRNRAKAVNYGIPYGLSATGLAQRLRCSIKEARVLMDTHRESFPGVHRFLSDQVELARDRGYASTLWGRRRYLPGLKAKNRMEAATSERVAVNMPIQGTQADMIKLAMVEVARIIRHRGLCMRMVLQVHDELLFEVPPFEMAEARAFVRDAMEGAITLSVPIEVNLGAGPTWLEAH